VIKNLDKSQEVFFYRGMEDQTSLLAEQLTQAEVFGLLTPEERLELASVAHRKPLKKGDVLWFQGDECHLVLYIAEGILRSVINAPDA
jgi:CRP-like cAMP-binding protein